MSEKSLSDKQTAFVEAYLQTWNATKAAKLAGYSEKTAYSQGHDLLKKPEIDSRVRARIAEMTMQADEVLLRLAGHARGDMGEMIDRETMGLDLKKVVNEGSSQLIKKLKQTTSSDGIAEKVTIEVELYDAQAALVHIGKHLGLFESKLDITSGGEQITTVNFIAVAASGEPGHDGQST